MKFRKLLCCAIAVILVLTIMIPTVFAATKCTVTQNVMFRQGPGTNYPAYGTLVTIRAKIPPFIGSLAISTVTLPKHIFPGKYYS